MQLPMELFSELNYRKRVLKKYLAYSKKQRKKKGGVDKQISCEAVVGECTSRV